MQYNQENFQARKPRRVPVPPPIPENAYNQRPASVPPPVPTSVSDNKPVPLQKKASKKAERNPHDAKENKPLEVTAIILMGLSIVIFWVFIDYTAWLPASIIGGIGVVLGIKGTAGEGQPSSKITKTTGWFITMCAISAVVSCFIMEETRGIIIESLGSALIWILAIVAISGIIYGICALRKKLKRK